MIESRLKTPAWSEQERLILVAAWDGMLTIPEVAREIETLCNVRRTRSAIAGKIHRMKLPKHKNGGVRIEQQTVKDLLPTDLDFIRQHLAVDMTVLEIARYFGIDPAQVHGSAEIMGLYHRNLVTHLARFHTPYAPVIGSDVRKATAQDERVPVMSMAEWSALHPALPCP